VNLIGAGRTLYLKNDPAGPHLWFVLTDPDSVTDQVVIVRVVTARQYTDKTLVLAAGVHPFVKQDSNVEYGSAKFQPVTALNRAINTGKCKLDADMSPALLQDVRRGLLASARTVHFIADHCKRCFPPCP